MTATTAEQGPSSVYPDDEQLSTWERHPADFARLIFSLAGLVVAVGFMAANPSGVRHLAEGLIDLFALIPTVITTVATGLAQIVAIVTPVALLVWLVWRRRFRIIGLIVVAAGLAVGAVFGLRHWLNITSPPIPEGRSAVRSWITGSRFPSSPYLAAAAAVITVLVPMLPRRWQRTAWWSLIGLAVLRLATAVAIPTHVVTVTLLGICVGSAILVVMGAPRRRTRLSDVHDALEAAGFQPSALHRVDDESLTGRLVGGQEIELRLVDRDDRDVDLLYRLITNAQRRGIENERFTWSPSVRVDHDALISLVAQRAGVAVTPVMGVAKTDEEAGILVLEHQDATGLDTLGPDDLDDALLDALWSNVHLLHDARIAHGQLNLGNVARVVLPSGETTVVLEDLSRAALSADTTRRATDIAELLVSCALAVGPERAVAAANRQHPDGLGPALPYLQSLALTPTTRQALRAAKDDRPELLTEVRQAVQTAAGLEEIKMAELQRISLGRAMSLFGTVVLAYIGLMFISNWSAMSKAMGDADWSYVPMIIALAGVTYPTGAMSMIGAVTGKLPFVQTTQIMLGQSFLNRFTPANIGGMALRTRYLQNHGYDLPVAATSIGLTSMASGIAQVFVIIGFVLAAGSSSQSTALPFSMPDISSIAIVIFVLLLVVGAVWLTPMRQRIVEHKLTLSVVEAWSSTRELAKRPSKLALLFGGAAIGKLATIVAFTLSCRALGIDIGFAQLGVLYMGANTVASAAPTPGGVGAMEAALAAVLTGAGVDPATALSAVLVFRLATYWLPVPPAWLALHHLRRTNVV